MDSRAHWRWRIAAPPDKMGAKKYSAAFAGLYSASISFPTFVHFAGGETSFVFFFFHFFTLLYFLTLVCVCVPINIFSHIVDSDNQFLSSFFFLR